MEQMSFDIKVGHEAASNLKFLSAHVLMTGSDSIKVDVVKASLVTFFDKYAGHPPDRKHVGKEAVSVEWIFEGKDRDANRLTQFIQGQIARYFCRNCGLFLPGGDSVCESCRAISSISASLHPIQTPKSKSKAKSGNGFGKIFGRKKSSV